MFRVVRRFRHCGVVHRVASTPIRSVQRSHSTTSHAPFTTHHSALSTSNTLEEGGAFELQPNPAVPRAEEPDEPSQSQSSTPYKPRPKGRFLVKQELPELVWQTPPAPKITSQAELDQLTKQGHDGNKKYDMLACWQLGQIYFDGITAAKTSASVAAASSPSDTPSDTSTAGSWSLPKNYTQSLLWFTNAAFEGHVPSRTRLGVMYLAGYGIKRNIPVAFQLFSEASSSGDRDAQAHLASMYLQGMGTPDGKKSVEKAIEWYTKAADRGHVRAQAVLAKLLDSPESGSLRDPARASHWLHESARLGNTDSAFLLGQRSLADSHQQFGHFYQAAKNGHAQAQFLIGMAFLQQAEPAKGFLASSSTSSSSSSSPPHLASARHWFSRATDQGNVPAQARLGFMMYHGVGGACDKGMAVMWMNNAAEANHVDAQLMLGSIAYDEHIAFAARGGVADSSSDIASLGDKDDDKKLQTAKHYFSKVLENANKNCTTLPSGSLPLLVRLTQDPALPSHLIKQFEQRTGQPWLGDINIFLAEIVPANKPPTP